MATLVEVVDENFLIDFYESWASVYTSGAGAGVSMVAYNGDLYAGIGGSGKIFVYNGSWSEFYDTGEAVVYALEVYGGNLYAATGTAGKIFVYNGSSWSVSYDSTETYIYSLKVYGSNLYAGSDPNGKVFVYNGSSWTESYASAEASILSLEVYGSNLYAGSSSNGKVFVYNGSSWTESYDSDLVAVYALRTYNSNLYACGTTNVGVTGVGKIYIYNGSSWTLHKEFAEHSVHAMEVYNGRLYAGVRETSGADTTFSIYHYLEGGVWLLHKQLGGNGIQRGTMEVYEGSLYAVSGSGVVYKHTDSALQILTVLITHLIHILNENISLAGLYLDHERNTIAPYWTTTSGTVDIGSGLNGTDYSLTLGGGGASGSASRTLSTPINRRIWLEYYLRVTNADDYVSVATAGMGLKGTGPLGGYVLQPRLVKSGANQVNLRYGIIEDDETVVYSSRVYITVPDTVLIQVELIRASSAVAQDGILRFWSDSVLISTVTGLNLYTYFNSINELNAILSSSAANQIKIDEVKIGYQEAAIIGDFIRLVNEDTDIEDTLLRIAAFINLLNETLSIEDSAIKAENFIRILSDNVSLIEDTIRAVKRLVSDTINLVEVMVGFIPRLKIINELLYLGALADLVLGAIINFCTLIDNVLPAPDGTISDEDRAQLLGLYIPQSGGGVGETLRIISRQANDIIQLILIGDANVVVTHENNDFSEYTTPPTECVEIVVPGLQYTNYSLKVYATCIIPGVVEFTAPTGNYFKMSFSLDMSCFTTEQGTTKDVGVRLSNGAGTEVLRTEVLSTNGVPTGLRVVLTDDNSVESTYDLTTTREDEHKYEFELYKATGATNNDATLAIYVDDILQTTLTGKDVYNQFDNMSYLEIGIMDVPGMDGYILIDEILVLSATRTAIYVLLTGLIVVLAENLSIIEDIVRYPLFLIKIIDETLNISETILKLFTLILKIIDENINLSETIQKVIGILQVIDEVLNIQEVITYILGLVRIIADTVNISETIIRVTNLLRVLDETLNITEGLIGLKNYIKVISEVINIEEVVIYLRSVVRIINDSFGLLISEGKIKVQGFVTVINDIINLIEVQIGPFANIYKIISENLEISELLYRFSSLLRLNNDTIQVTEGSLTLRSLLKLVNEVINIEEIILTLKGYVRIIGETLLIFEALRIVKALVRIINEVVNIQEVVQRIKVIIQLINENVTIITGILTSKSILQIVNETLSIIEEILKKSALYKVISEQIEFRETILKLRALVRIKTEYILIKETFQIAKGLGRIIGETLSIIESITHRKNIKPVVSDTLEVAEDVSGSPILYLISRIADVTGVQLKQTIKGTNIYQLGVRGIKILSSIRGVKFE